MSRLRIVMLRECSLHFSRVVVAFMACALAWGECIPFQEARKHIGATGCVSGKVIRVEEGDHFVTYLDFCEDYRVCPFTVVVFRSDLRNVGDVRPLAGRNIEIHGDIKEYDGRAEIILRRPKQLGEGAALVPPLPKTYDVERKGHYSAGRFSHPKAAKNAKPKRQSKPATIQDLDPEQ